MLPLPLLSDFLDQAERTRESVQQVLAGTVQPLLTAEALDQPTRRALITAFGDSGWIGATIPPDWGGSGLGHLAKVIAVEETARAHTGAGATLSAAALGTGLLTEFGNSTQRIHWLPRLSTGQDVMTICMTEPESGSHLAGMGTRASRVPGGWRLAGRKWFIGNSTIATVHGVIARTGADELSAFLVESDRIGVRAEHEHGLTGMQGFSLGNVEFDDCFVPEENLVGRPGDGLGFAHRVLTCHGKANIGAVALGIGQRCFDIASSYTKRRVLYGKPLAALPAVQDQLGELYTRLYLARLSMYHAASRLDNDRDHDIGLMIGKLMASEAAVDAAIGATKLMGARGTHPELEAVRLISDALMTIAPSGTSEVNRKRIAEVALGRYRGLVPPRPQELLPEEMVMEGNS